MVNLLVKISILFLNSDANKRGCEPSEIDILSTISLDPKFCKFSCLNKRIKCKRRATIIGQIKS
ncbi:hypothetical protein HanIR_Chr16g0798111 [Helianthus annuus]|nr:hypothetical protein HanIR_Chr16g0798111 [Helianthus annuus]